MKTYPIVEIFETLQGEGRWAGTPAVFVRFGGCNLWSGHVEDRARDYERTKGACAIFCDTEFTKTERLDAKEIGRRVRERAMAQTEDDAIAFVVFTGGEPLLSLDAALLEAIFDSNDVMDGRIVLWQFAVETNGTVELEPELDSMVDWVCVSPKTPRDRIKLVAANELKVVVPAMNPHDFDELFLDRSDPDIHTPDALPSFVTECFVQPAAMPDLEIAGKSTIIDSTVRDAIAFCLRYPGWRLSFQLHKILGLR